MTRPEAGKLTFWIGPQLFEEFLGIPVGEVIDKIGPGDWQRLSQLEIDRFVASLETLMSTVIADAPESNLHRQW